MNNRPDKVRCFRSERASELVQRPVDANNFQRQRSLLDRSKAAVAIELRPHDRCLYSSRHELQMRVALIREARLRLIGFTLHGVAGALDRGHVVERT